MDKDCLICAYSELRLRDTRVFCHHPITPYVKVIGRNDKCPANRQKQKENNKKYTNEFAKKCKMQTMNIAEEQALKAYPKRGWKCKDAEGNDKFLDANRECRLAFVKGYEQAKEDIDEDIHICHEESFNEGVQFAKEQMIKNAIEGGCFSYRNGYLHISCDIDENLTDIKFGDKVKIIIIKD